MLVQRRVPQHFHMLLTGRHVLAIGVAISFPDDPIEYNPDFATRPIRIDRSLDKNGGNFLVEIHRDNDMSQREHEDQKTADVLTILPGASLLRGPQKADILHAFLHLKAEVLEDRRGGRQQLCLITCFEQAGLHRAVYCAFRCELKQLTRVGRGCAAGELA